MMAIQGHNLVALLWKHFKMVSYHWGTGTLSNCFHIPSSVPNSVDNVALTPLLTSLEASWEQPSVPNGIIILYEVCYYRYTMGSVNDACAVNTNVTETTYKAVGLVPTATYVFRVRAYTVAGYGEWTNKAVTLPNIRKYQLISDIEILCMGVYGCVFFAAAVEGLSVNIVTATALLVHWTALEIQTLSVSLYTVYYKAYSEKRNGTVAELHSVPNNQTSFLLDVRDLTPGLQHQFQVTASVELHGEVIEGEANEDAVVFGKYMNKQITARMNNIIIIVIGNLLS